MSADTYRDHPGRLPGPITTVYEIWAEWDVGQKGAVFSSEEKARAWCDTNEHLLEMVADGDFESVEDIIDQGLLGVEPLEVDPE